MRILLGVLLLPFCVLAKTVQVNFDYEMPKDVNSLKYDFILKNEARKQALGKIDAGILVGKRTLNNGMLSERITKLTPLVLSVDSLTYSYNMNNHFKVKADVSYKYDDITQLAKSLAGLDKLQADNTALKNRLHDIEKELLTLRYKNIQKQKFEAYGKKDSKSKDAVFYVDTTSELKFVNYTEEELKDIARFYANIVQDYFLSEINYLKPKLTIDDNSNTLHEELLIRVQWGFNLDLKKFKNKYNDYFTVERANSGDHKYVQSELKDLFGRRLKPKKVYVEYNEPFKYINNRDQLSVYQIKPKLANATSYTLDKLQSYFDNRVINQMVKLSNSLEASNGKNKNIVRYVFAIIDNYFIFDYKASIIEKVRLNEPLSDYKKWVIKSFETPFSEKMGASWRNY